MFTDDNGRTGRVLNSLFFISQDLFTLPILYLSGYIIQHKADYYRLLLEVTRNAAWEAWVLFMLKGVEQTSRRTMAKIAAIRTLQSQTVEYVRNTAPKIYSHELLTDSGRRNEYENLARPNSGTVGVSSFHDFDVSVRDGKTRRTREACSFQLSNCRTEAHAARAEILSPRSLKRLKSNPLIRVQGGTSLKND